MNLHIIGPFQFQNLVRNRIPFTLLNFGADLAGLFQPFYQSHLEKMNLPTSAESFLRDLEGKGEKTDAVVVLDLEGAQVGSLVEKLLQAGYTNVFGVDGGLRSLRENRD